MHNLPKGEKYLEHRLTILAVFYLIILSTVVILNQASVSAHQSGCHRWHSCPSDSGSYVCGDLGYTSGCVGSTTYIAPTVDYTAQGRSSGESHALTKDLASINSYAQQIGSADGAVDGKSGAIKLARPQPDTTCDRTFTFDTPQDPLYVAGYTAGYKARCSELFTTAYSLAYSTSYNTGKATLNAEEAEKKKSSEDAIWTWLVLGGIACWMIYAAVKKARA